MLYNKWRLFLGSLVISSLFAITVRVPFNSFFTIFGLLGSLAYYIFSAGICILFFHLIRVRNSTDIFYKPMSAIGILFAGLYGMALAYVVRTYLGPIYSFGYITICLSLVDILSIIALNIDYVLLYDVLQGGAAISFFSNVAGGGGSGAAAQPALPSDPAGRAALSHVARWAVTTAQGGQVVVPDLRNQAAGGYSHGFSGWPYSYLLAESIRLCQTHSQMPNLDPLARAWLNGWLQHNRPNDYLANGVVNPNNPHRNLVYPCSKKNLDDIKKILIFFMGKLKRKQLFY